MQISSHNKQPLFSIKTVIICVLSIVVLFLGFFSNYWKVADQQWFSLHQRDMEGHIIGRMIKSRQDGMFSVGGFIGWGSLDKTPLEFSNSTFDLQYKAYRNDLKFGVYTSYNSQIGGQGMVFSILDHFIPLSSNEKLNIFHALVSLLSAVVLTLIILWFYQEFGLTVGLIVLASTVLSQWLVVFGRNLFWSMWAFYLPMIVTMYYFQRNREYTNSQFIRFGFFIFGAIFIKCLFTGYEYITTTLIMMMVPFIYYSILDKLKFTKICRGLFIAAFASCVAISLSVIIVCFQIASIEGSFFKGIEYLMLAFQKRTYSNPNNFFPVYAESLNVSISYVFVKYLKGTFFNFNNYVSTSSDFISRLLFEVRYLYVIFLFFVMSIILYIRKNKYCVQEEGQRNFALIIATWFSILAPLSWIVIFKAHSYIHGHMNFIIWQMPFTLFGFALCGVVIKNFFMGKYYNAARVVKK